MKLFKPTTLKFAVEKARLQDMAIEGAQRKSEDSFKPPAVVNNYTNVKASRANTVRPNAFRLSPEVYEYIRNNHLCIRCGKSIYQVINAKRKR